MTTNFVRAGLATAILIAGASGVLAQGTDVDQTPTNSGPINNLNGSISVTGGLTGVGSSATISATGAAAAASVTSVNGISVTSPVDLPPPVGGFGTVTQNATNLGSGTVSNAPLLTGIAVGGDMARGTSASITATGALSAFSITGITGTDATPWNVPDVAGLIDQSAANSAGVTNASSAVPASISGVGQLGAGASVSTGATGAATSTAFSFNGPGDADGGVLNGISQAAHNLGGNIVNWGALIETGALVGPAASVSSSATGAIASISISHIEVDTEAAIVNDGTIVQNSSNAVGTLVHNRGQFETGALQGPATSATVSATGAAAAVSVSSINSPTAAQALGDVTQTAVNTGVVDNVNNTVPTLTTGALSGAGASASVSATGAITSVSLLRIGSTGPEASISAGEINQTSTNNAAGAVINAGSITVDGAISGPATSATVSATGAAASVSSSSINAGGSVAGPAITSITQTVGNAATVNNTGTISAAGLTGAGASASVSAVGAGAYVSFSAIKGP